MTGKQVLYYTPNTHNGLGMTATKAAGFWYVGNVYDTADIAYGVAQHGLVEPGETALVERIFATIGLQKKPVVYDIGANTGYYSLLAACKYHSQVVAFEPVPAHVACLAESAQLNNVAEHVRIFTCALGEHTSKEELYLSGTGSSLDSAFIGNPDAPHTSVQVETLDTLIAHEGLTLPDFIKIDVEGHERKVLTGAHTLLTQTKPVLFVEITATIKARDFINSEYAETFALLARYGYVAYRLDGTRLVSHDATQAAPDGVHMYLFLDPHTHAFLKEAVDI